MDASPPIEQRLMALELKASDAEDTLEQLNTALYRQQQQIDRLQQALRELLSRQPETGAPRSLRDELPPHY
jgi:SlyX protein